ncbi:MAG: hypothetical protein ACTSW1_14325 [Candidatus Hodarchaeales archaeon]
MLQNEQFKEKTVRAPKVVEIFAGELFGELVLLQHRGTKFFGGIWTLVIIVF